MFVISNVINQNSNYGKYDYYVFFIHFFLCFASRMLTLDTFSEDKFSVRIQLFIFFIYYIFCYLFFIISSFFLSVLSIFYKETQKNIKPSFNVHIIVLQMYANEFIFNKTIPNANNSMKIIICIFKHNISES